MSYLSDNEKFKNEASRRFYNYFQEKIKNGELSIDDFCDSFGLKKDATKYQFLSSIKQGKRSVTIDQLFIAVDRYNISPAYIFGKSSYVRDLSIAELGEDEVELYSMDRQTIGEKIRALIDKHDVRAKEYSAQIGMSEGNFQKILRGDVRPYFDLVVRVCDDFGESLDQFRTRPLPKGHILTQLKAQENLIRAHEKRIKELESELQGKRASA